ncbi:urease subunit beta [Streptodolium elevatio]|uniref:urease subunit beta n=1 Tax=Streptodolium elevatio TaxID=3157996 RepID=UPI003F4CB268
MVFRQQYIYGDDPIELNAGRRTLTVSVDNTGDRAVQVGSHYHFFEVNSALSFDRSATVGMRLNIAAGTSVRFEPGGTREVELCEFGGTRRLVGFSGLLNGSVVSRAARAEAARRAVERGFAGATATVPDPEPPTVPAKKATAKTSATKTAAKKAPATKAVTAKATAKKSAAKKTAPKPAPKKSAAKSAKKGAR